jgi:hypothetical protein
VYLANVKSAWVGDHNLTEEGDSDLDDELESDGVLALGSVRESDGDDLVLANDSLAIGIYREDWSCGPR